MDDLTEDRVLTVEFVHVARGDVELAAAGLARGIVGIAQASHPDGAKAMRASDLFGERGFESSGAPACTRAWVFRLRIAHLYEVVWNDAVDGHALVVMASDILLKVGDGEGGVCRIKLDGETTGLAEDVELEDGRRFRGLE